MFAEIRRFTPESGWQGGRLCEVTENPWPLIGHGALSVVSGALGAPIGVPIARCTAGKRAEGVRDPAGEGIDHITVSICTFVDFPLVILLDHLNGDLFLDYAVLFLCGFFYCISKQLDDLCRQLPVVLLHILMRCHIGNQSRIHLFHRHAHVDILDFHLDIDRILIDFFRVPDGIFHVSEGRFDQLLGRLRISTQRLLGLLDQTSPCHLVDRIKVRVLERIQRLCQGCDRFVRCRGLRRRRRRIGSAAGGHRKYHDTSHQGDHQLTVFPHLFFLPCFKVVVLSLRSLLQNERYRRIRLLFTSFNVI